MAMNPKSLKPDLQDPDTPEWLLWLKGRYLEEPLDSEAKNI